MRQSKSNIFFVCLCMFAVSACGTTKPPPGNINTVADDAQDNHDPLEGFNRAMYTFNEKVDKYALKPVAKGYQVVTPKFVRRGVANFFNNLGEPLVIINDFLQGKARQGSSDLGRFLVNTTLGLFGLFDVATKMGLTRHNEDFGQTLGVWGVGEGPYLVLPFFGPSTLRDGAGLVVDESAHPINQIDEKSTRSKVSALRVIDARARLLNATDILEQAGGVDPYAFTRELYRSRRRDLVNDGQGPRQALPNEDEVLFGKD